MSGPVWIVGLESDSFESLCNDCEDLRLQYCLQEPRLPRKIFRLACLRAVAGPLMQPELPIATQGYSEQAPFFFLGFPCFWVVASGIIEWQHRRLAAE